MLYLVVTRVSGTRRRRKVKTLLRSHGYEILPNVYECTLIPAQAEELRSRLEMWLGVDDQIRLYQVCESCRSRSWEHGGPPTLEDPGPWVF